MKNPIVKKISAFAFCWLILSGCGVIDKTRTEQYTAYGLDDRAIVHEQLQRVGQMEEKEIIKEMEKVLENEYLELYLGGNYDIGVYDKRTEAVFLSNPVFYEYTKEEQEKLLPETKKALFSQVDIEYFDSRQKAFALASYPDSYSENKNQVTTAVVDNQLIVTYGIGTRNQETGLIPAFTAETYSYYDEKLKEMREKKEISLIQYRDFVNNYTKILYENLKASDREVYANRYPTLQELGEIYIIKPNLTNKSIQDMLKIYRLLEIHQEVMEAEKEKIGIVEGIDLPAYFEIPVRYQFHENDLVVTVDTKDITAAEGYYLTRVHILKSFLHATENQEGYIFVPDGSGMVIENQKANRSMDKISIPFYGADFAKNYRKDLDIEIDSTFPVFGIRAGDRAVFAIVENGEAMGGVTAQIKSSYLPYNIVYPYLNYVSYDSFNRQGVAYGFSKVIPAAAYSIRYHFLYGQNSTYAGMARYYQTYLEQKGWIRKAEGEANLPIDINLIGTITKTVNKVGFPIEAQYPVTTFENAADIMESLKAGGIDNGDLLYSGMINKGMNFIAPKKVAIQKELGGLEGFKSLYRGLGSMGYELYTDVDFTRIYDKGNGVGGKEDVSKYLSKNTAVIASYYPADNQKDYKTASYLVNPLLYEKIGASFVQSHQKTGHHTLYLSTIGSMLSSNFSEKSELTREEVKQLTVSLLRHLKENGYQMKFDGGNQYVLPFAESLTNVETSSSGRRIESYSVPFVGMVLKGYVPYTAIAVNKSGNYERAVLEAVESGAGLNYLLMYEDQLTLVDTQYKDLFSIHYRLWMDRIIETYQKLNQDLGYLSNKAIINHTKVEEEVFCVTYEEGTEVYVNYSNADFYVGGNQVSAMGYYVQRSKARGRNSDDE